MKPPKRKARKKAAGEAAAQKAVEHIGTGYSKIKEMRDAEVASERDIAAASSKKANDFEVTKGGGSAQRKQGIAGSAYSGKDMAGAGAVNAMNRYEGRGSGAAVAGGTKKQVRKSQRQSLQNNNKSKQAQAATKRSFKKKY